VAYPVDEDVLDFAARFLLDEVGCTDRTHIRKLAEVIQRAIEDALVEHED
jgi:hypothetical protein